MTKPMFREYMDLLWVPHWNFKAVPRVVRETLEDAHRPLSGGRMNIEMKGYIRLEILESGGTLEYDVSWS